MPRRSQLDIVAEIHSDLVYWSDITIGDNATLGEVPSEECLASPGLCTVRGDPRSSRGRCAWVRMRVGWSSHRNPGCSLGTGGAHPDWLV